MLLRSLSAFTFCVLASASLLAQNGALTGTVSADSLGKQRLAAAEVAIPSLNRTTRTNYLGDFLLTSVPPGRYLVMVRVVGYQSVSDSVTVAAGERIYHDFVMAAKVVVLDSVVTTGKAGSGRYISPALRGFEERRSQGFGSFIGEEELRRSDHRLIADVMIGHVPGIRFNRDSRGAGAYLASSRAGSQGCQYAMIKCNIKKSSSDVRFPDGCYATVYLDGTLVYDMVGHTRASGETEPPPNLNEYAVNELAGIEFYAGAATVPAGFKSSPCGTVLLWTRER